VAAQEAEEKTAEMTKAVDELKKLLKQATHGEIFCYNLYLLQISPAGHPVKIS